MAYGYGYQHGQPAGYGYGYGYGRQVRLSAPASVHLVAILQYLGGLLGLLGAGLIAVLAFAGSRYADDPDLPADARNLIAGGGILLAGVVAFVALFAILLGRKLQRGRQWARVLVLTLSAVNLLGAVYAVFAQDLRTQALPALVGPVCYLVLLNTRAARSWFRHGTY